MIIVAKDKDRVYMAQMLFSPYGDNYDYETHYSKNNALLFKLKNHKNFIVGQSGNNMLADIMRYNPSIFDKEIDVDNLVQNAVPKLKSFAKNYKCFCSSDNTFLNKIFVAQNDRAYVISYNGFVQEIEEFDVVCSDGIDICFGSLERTKGLPIMERIKTAIIDYSFSNCTKPIGFIVMDTKTTKLKYIAM